MHERSQAEAAVQRPRGRTKGQEPQPGSLLWDMELEGAMADRVALQSWDLTLCPSVAGPGAGTASCSGCWAPAQLKSTVAKAQPARQMSGPRRAVLTLALAPLPSWHVAALAGRLPLGTSPASSP